VTSPPSPRAGAAFALLAFGAWGAVPLFWRAIARVPSLEVLAHRVAWSMLVLVALVVVLRQGREVRAVLGSWSRLRYLLASGALITVNWGLFIWAVQNGHLLDASLGYFVNPLVNVALGVVLLRETVRPLQRVSIAVAALGVLVLVVGLHRLPWIALVLATTFGAYGLLRKLAPVEAIVGLTVETMLVTPIAVAYLARQTLAGESAFVQWSPAFVAFVALAGPITALPLVWFAAAARRLPLSTLGFFQYLAPTLQFLIAVVVFREPLRPLQLASFAAIWLALAIYTWDAVQWHRRSRVTGAAISSAGKRRGR
jgi:chloramphenicol-sensitive protein RarD